MRQRLLFWTLGAMMLCLLATPGELWAQCTTCTFTATTGGNYNLTGNQTLCVTGTIGDFNMNVSGTGNKICVAPGATWTISSGLNFNSNLIIDVYGTLNANGSYNVNGGAKPVINIYNGATMNTNTGGFSNGLAINNDGTLNFTAPSSVTVTNSGNFTLVNSATGVVSATTTNSYFVFGQGSTVLNSGSMTFANLENSESDIRNLEGGVITIGRRFYNHGNLINDSQINTICGPFGSVACEFIVGDKGAGKTYTITSTGCMSVTGTTTFNGPGFVNGTLEITGDLTINKPVSGSNGRIIVNNGVSTISLSGAYNGTNMKFCDKNTANNKFDVVQANNPLTTVVYTVDCSPNTCSSSTPAPCTLAATATPGTCNSATNQYTVTGTISLTNNTAGGTATITDGAKSTTVTISASATSVAYSLSGLTSGTGSHTVTVSLPGCGTTTATYSAPASCTVASPALTVSVGTPACNSATNNYTATGTVSLSNVPAGATLTITDNGSTVAVVSLTAGQPSASFSVSGVSNASSHTVVASLSGGTSASATYSAPASCTVASPALTVSVGTPVCNSATNNYTATGTVSLSNVPAGATLTITDNGSTVAVVSLTAGQPSASFSVSGVSNASSHTVVASLSGGTSASATYSAPASCTVSCPEPITVCAGTEYAFKISGPDGQASYQWYLNGQPIAGATASSYTATQAGSYSLVVNGDGGCINGSCCPIVIEEVAGVPSFSLVAQAPTCSGATSLTNGQLTITNLGSFTAGQYTYQYVVGASFASATALPASPAPVPADGIILSTLAGGETITVRVYNALTGCYADQTVIVPTAACECPPTACIPVVVRKVR